VNSDTEAECAPHPLELSWVLIPPPHQTHSCMESLADEMSSMSDDKVTIGELKKQVREFRDERNWTNLDTPRNLAISIAIEGAELLEHFQWEDQPEITDKIADELADVMIYCLGFSDILKIDVSQALTRKLEKNRKKYPVE